MNKIKEVPSEVEEVQEVRIPSEIEVSEENTQKIEEEENLSQIDLMNLSVVVVSEENTHKIEGENLKREIDENEVELIPSENPNEEGIEVSGDVVR